MCVPWLGVVQTNLNSNCDFSEADVQTSKPIQAWGKHVSPEQMHSTVSLLATLKYKLPFLEVVSWSRERSVVGVQFERVRWKEVAPSVIEDCWGGGFWELVEGRKGGNLPSGSVMTFQVSVWLLLKVTFAFGVPQSMKLIWLKTAEGAGMGGALAWLSDVIIPTVSSPWGQGWWLRTHCLIGFHLIFSRT